MPTGSSRRLAVDPELHRQASLADLRHERGQIGQRRLRREPVGGVGPQHADQPAHLGERAAPDLLDGLQHLAGRAVRQDAPLGTGLDDHHRDAVRHRVVQFPCDPGALLDDRLAGGDVPLALGQPGPAVTVADDAAEEQHHDDGAEGEPDRGAAPVGRVGVPPHRRQVGQPDEGRARHEVPARGPDGQAVQRAEPGDRPPAGRQVVPSEEVQRHEALGGHPRGGRIPLAEPDGRAGGDGEQGAESLLVQRAWAERDLQQRRGGEDGGDDPVALPFVAQPQAHAVTVIPADLLVIGQPDEAAAAENRPTARSEDRPLRR